MFIETINLTYIYIFIKIKYIACLLKFYKRNKTWYSVDGNMYEGCKTITKYILLNRYILSARGTRATTMLTLHEFDL